jgi:serine/threonine-protein kinase
MDSLRWQRVQDLFFAVSKVSKPERPVHLHSLCPGDEELRREVLSLLDADEQTNSFVDGSAPAVDPAILPALLRKYAEDAFRPYRLKHVLGEGGMGVVWLAERSDIGTLVAIKILRDGAFSPARLERFAAEQRTLGQLNHPSIARIYDADTLPDGTPWFAMEYVDGIPLNQYCNECECSFDERLQLFKTVCEAVDYAHSQAIIHRDLKPSNILVKNGGILKLVDFGIAKQMSAGDSPDGTRVMTLSYASPEQIQGKSVGAPNGRLLAGSDFV